MNKINKDNFKPDAYKYGFVTEIENEKIPKGLNEDCLLYTSPSPRDRQKSRMPSSA